MMKKRKLTLWLVALGGASAMMWTLLNEESEIQTIRIEDESQRIPAAISIQDAFQSSESTQASNSLIQDLKNEATIGEPAISGALPQPETIQKFKLIQTKIFKSEDELKYLKKIIRNAKLIQQLGQYLRDSESLQKDEFKTDQNAVIDLLIEALKDGDTQAAELAIFDVIKDTQVENEKLPLKTRELLGGLKADLLYQSSAVKPELSEQFAGILPGPVSQKIWQNVQRQQADNLALSEAELQARRKSQN